MSDPTSDTSRIDLTEDDLTQLALLRSLEIDELVEASLIPPSSRFDETLLYRVHYGQREIDLRITTGPTYPVQQLEIEYENKSLPRLVMDTLRIECRKIVFEGEEKNNVEAWRGREEDGLFEFDMTALRVLRAAREFLQRYRDDLIVSASTIEVLRAGDGAPLGTPRKLPPNSLKNQYIPDRGADASTFSVDTTASTILNRLPEEICALIPSSFRILHVESVLRADLYSKFQLCQSEMAKELATHSILSLKKCIPHERLEKHGRDTPESMAKYLTTPKMTFHGTSNRFVPSIVRHGFLAPGSKHPETHEPLPIRCGSTYGQGIYSSPSAQFSLSYSGSEARPTTKEGFWGLKLIVCATIMGRSAQMRREDEWWTRTKPFEGADSHTGNNNMEYIVFDNSQILPCYVIHLDWGRDNEFYFENIDEDKANFVENLQKMHSKLTGMEMMPGDRQREKQALMAKALKYFPYGYGPATGTRFVVEEVGEVDEDEEDYGDYQQMRIDATNEKGTFWEWEEEESGDKGAPQSKLDEYAQFRFGKEKTGIGRFNG